MNESTLKIKVIGGSVRQGRFNDKPAAWITAKLKERSGIEAELLDLRDYEMPFFNEAESPSAKQEPYQHPTVAAWTAKIAEADAFVVVTPEYNHAPSAVLKNAIDWVGPEWARKAVGFVSYGTVGGARAVEQLRVIVGELQMADMRAAVHIPGHQFFPVLMGQGSFEDIAPSLEDAAKGMIDQLLWWARALQAARAEEAA